MRVIVNGKPREVDGAADRREVPLLTLLSSYGVNPRLVAVAINGDVIRKADYAAAVVANGDAVEIVRMVGGGA